MYKCKFHGSIHMKPKTIFNIRNHFILEGYLFFQMLPAGVSIAVMGSATSKCRGAIATATCMKM